MKIFYRLLITCLIIIGISYFAFKKIEKKLNPEIENIKISKFEKPDINSVIREKYEYVKEIDCDGKTLEEIISKGNDFILELGAKWCYPCWVAKNDFEDNAKKLKGIDFYYLDFDKCKNYKWIFNSFKIEPFKIRAVPHLFHYEKGKVNHFSGYSSSWIENTLRPYLK